MQNVVERVSQRAMSIEPVKVALTIVMLPFYVLGAIVGIVWFIIRWVLAAAAVGFNDIARRQ